MQSLTQARRPAPTPDPALTPALTPARATDLPPDLARELARLDRLANLLDARFGLFGIRFGLDGLLGLVPGLGDTLTLAPSAWIVWRAWKLGAPRDVLLRMAGNTGVDYLVGLIPVLGDLFDIGFKGNLRNANLLRDHILSDERILSQPQD